MLSLTGSCHLILGKDFKKPADAEMKRHLDEWNVSDIQSATTIADDYTLSHKSGGFRHKAYLVNL